MAYKFSTIFILIFLVGCDLSKKKEDAYKKNADAILQSVKNAQEACLNESEHYCTEDLLRKIFVRKNNDLILLFSVDDLPIDMKNIIIEKPNLDKDSYTIILVSKLGNNRLLLSILSSTNGITHSFLSR